MGRDTLCAPDLGALPGVTSAAILDEARARSVPFGVRRVRPNELIRNEVWLVNALHGIRRVKESVYARSEPQQTREQTEADDGRERRHQWSESQRRPISLEATNLRCP